MEKDKVLPPPFLTQNCSLLKMLLVKKQNQNHVRGKIQWYLPHLVWTLEGGESESKQASFLKSVNRMAEVAR